jgi:hypothetical protein
MKPVHCKKYNTTPQPKTAWRRKVFLEQFLSLHTDTVTTLLELLSW